MLEESINAKMTRTETEKGKTVGPAKKSAAGKSIKVPRPSSVWMVFVTEESGTNGYYGGCGDYDNGSHSATLHGVYCSESEARRHAEDLHQDGDDDDEDDNDDDENPCERRQVTVVKSEVRSKYNEKSNREIWRFDADVDLDAPRNHY